MEDLWCITHQLVAVINIGQYLVITLHFTVIVVYCKYQGLFLSLLGYLSMPQFDALVFSRSVTMAFGMGDSKLSMKVITQFQICLNLSFDHALCSEFHMNFTNSMVGYSQIRWAFPFQLVLSSVSQPSHLMGGVQALRFCVLCLQYATHLRSHSEQRLHRAYYTWALVHLSQTTKPVLRALPFTLCCSLNHMLRYLLVRLESKLHSAKLGSALWIPDH